MRPANTTHQTLLRHLLEQRIGELRGEIAAAAQATRDATGATDNEVQDQKDEAGKRVAAEVDDAQQQRDRDELAACEAALRRFDSGHYGLCTDCGEPIPFARLQVQPSAARCAVCQQAAETRAAARTPH